MDTAASAADVDTDEIGNAVGVETDDEPAPAEQAAGTVGRRERKPLNKALFARAVAAARSHVNDDPLPDDDEVAPTGPAAAKAAELHAQTEKKASIPEAPSGPDPKAIAAWERTNVRAAELDRREAALVEREQRTRDVATRFSADPYKALQDTVRADLGEGATDTEVNDEVTWQLTQMSLSHAGAEVPADNVGHQLKKLTREVNQRKVSERKAARDAEAKRAAGDKETRTKAAIAQIGHEFSSPRQDALGKPMPPLAAAYPWLAAAEDPAEVLFDVIKSEHDRSGTLLELDAAAQLANDHLAKANKDWFSKRSHLLAPTPAPTPAAAIVPQGDPQHRRSRTLTNADASEESAPAPDVPGRPLSTEERRRKTIGKWLSKLKESDKD